jgi:hypothetical protein
MAWLIQIAIDESLRRGWVEKEARATALPLAS